MRSRGRWRRQGRVMVVRRARESMDRGRALATERYGDTGQATGDTVGLATYGEGYLSEVIRTETYSSALSDRVAQSDSPLWGWQPFIPPLVDIKPIVRESVGYGIRAALRGRGIV